MIAEPIDMTTARILLVDDDPGIRSAVGEFLGRYGYDVETAADAAAADRAMAQGAFDIAVLDVMMPGENGLSLARRLSERGDAPSVIMMSAAGEATDRIIGIESGADSYLPKPCNPHELLAHVRSALRRRTARTAPEVRGGSSYAFAGWSLDLLSRVLRRPDGVIVNLSSGEFGLLRTFVERPGRVLSRDQLLDYARGQDSEAFDRAIDVQISRLRRKLDRDSGEEMIRTVRSEGYMFVASVTRH